MYGKFKVTFILYNASIIIMKSCFKTTSIKLELLTEIKMILFHEEGVTAGVKRVIYVEASNKYMYDYSE